MATYKVIGQPTPRAEGPEKVTGNARYTADVRLPGTLWGRSLRSPFPHAKIINIDISRAAEVPGVHAVLTGADLQGTLQGRKLRDTPVLAWDRVRFAGERVAAVAADDADMAKRALALIDVQYEELPPTFDPQEAIREGATLLHPNMLEYAGLPRPGDPIAGGGRIDLLEKPSNVFSRRIIENGDIREGFAQSDLTFEYTFTTPATHQAYLEPHNCLVWIDSEGRVQVWASNKGPFLLREELSSAVGVPPDRILVNHAHIGGDFGGKGSSMDVPLCYFLAQKTGRPVRMVMDYVEELGAGNPRHPSVIKLKTGVMRDGTLVALEGTIIFNAGAYGGFTPMGFLPGAYHLAGCYKIPHTYTEALQVYTNGVPGGHMRGPGEAQVMFAMESNIDCIAREMNIDPFEFRMANLVTSGDTAGSGERYEDIAAKETLQAAAEAADFRAPKPMNVGRGIAMGDRAPGGGETHVVLTLSQDGSAVLHTSVYDQGAGSYTLLRQIVAEETGLDPIDVEVSVWDTATGAFDSGMGASRNTRMVSQAAHEATQEVLQQLYNLATEILGWPTEHLVLTGRNIMRPDTGEDHAWADILTKAGQTVTGHGDFKDMSRSPVTSFAAQIAEVSVDPDTGEVHLLRFVSAHDVGTILDPVGHQGQINGGVIQGVGYALTEQLLAEDGRITNVSFGDYKIPSIMDVPPMETVLLESQSGVGPYAIKGIGENPIGPVAPAIANAIADAIGVRINDLPLTAEKVYWALHRK